MIQKLSNKFLFLGLAGQLGRDGAQINQVHIWHASKFKCPSCKFKTLASAYKKRLRVLRWQTYTLRHPEPSRSTSHNGIGIDIKQRTSSIQSSQVSSSCHDEVLHLQSNLESSRCLRVLPSSSEKGRKVGEETFKHDFTPKATHSEISFPAQSIQQLQEMITNAVKEQYGGSSQNSLTYSKPYTKRNDSLKMPIVYQPPEFQQFDGKCWFLPNNYGFLTRYTPLW